MFSRSKTLSVTIPTGIDTHKTITVKYPEDAAWSNRQRKRRSIVKNLGRGMSKTETLNGEEADHALVMSCLVSVVDQGGIELTAENVDKYESALVVEEISMFELSAVEKAHGRIEMLFDTPMGEVRHCMRMPTPKEVFDHRRYGSSVSDGPAGQVVQIHVNYTADLYDKLHVDHFGYEESVPVMHKWSVVHTLLGQFNAAAGLTKEESF